jgi:exopolysaccharide biosynthesis predicted pyruvyltransferase EpsI
MTEPQGPERIFSARDGEKAGADSEGPTAGLRAQELQLKVMEGLQGLLVGVSEVALVGFPFHANAGDSLIWLGQLALLEKLGIRVRLVEEQSAHNSRVIDALPANVPLLVSGGGNFGDLWPTEHQYREKILSEARTRRIIQLPQSFCFRQSANLSATQRLVSNHSDLVLTWRDTISYESALKAFPDTPSLLVPDVAFALGEMIATGPKQWPIICISRTDQEGGELRAVTVPEGCQADWNYSSAPMTQKLGYSRSRPGRCCTAVTPRQLWTTRFG